MGSWLYRCRVQQRTGRSHQAGACCWRWGADGDRKGVRGRRPGERGAWGQRARRSEDRGAGRRAAKAKVEAHGAPVEWFSQRDRGPSPLVASARGREEKRRRLRGESAPCGNSGAVAAGGRRRWSLAVLSLPPVVAPTAWRGRLGETSLQGRRRGTAGGRVAPTTRLQNPPLCGCRVAHTRLRPWLRSAAPSCLCSLAPASERGGSGNQSLSCKSLSDVSETARQPR